MPGSLFLLVLLPIEIDELSALGVLKELPKLLRILTLRLARVRTIVIEMSQPVIVVYICSTRSMVATLFGASIFTLLAIATSPSLRWILVAAGLLTYFLDLQVLGTNGKATTAHCLIHPGLDLILRHLDTYFGAVTVEFSHDVVLHLLVFHEWHIEELKLGL